MIVIKRNGKTTVLTGWRAWLAVAVIFAAVWLVLVLLAIVFIGATLTVGFMLLLALPAVLIAGVIHVVRHRSGAE